LFFDLSSIQTSTFVEGQDPSNFYTAMNSVSSRKTAVSRDDSCLALGGFVSNWQIVYGQKIPEMHIAFVALLEELMEWSPSTYNFRREPVFAKSFFSRAMKGCCKAL
jgi:hypothetical protein